MNKFAAIILLAFVACVACQDVQLVDLEDPETQAALTPSNEEETAGLVGDMTVFSDFCTKSRDYVLGDIKTQTNSLASTIFSIFFKNAEEIGQSGLDAGKAVAEHEIEAIKNTDSSIVKPQTLFHSVVSTVGAAANTVSSGVVASLNSLKGAFGVGQVIGAITTTCNQFAHYEEQNRVAFAEFVKTIAAKDQALGETPFEKVACLTAKRVSRIDSICKLAQVAQGPVQNIMRSMQ